MGKKDVCHARQTKSRADGADQQQFLASHAVDDRHGDYGGEQIDGANGDGLNVTGNFAETCPGKDVVQVVENRIDAGELIEHADGNGEKDGHADTSG